MGSLAPRSGLITPSHSVCWVNSSHQNKRAPPAPAGKGGEYPTGGDDDALMGELTLDELKMAFRLFDAEGEGFIRVLTFRGILKEIDEDFSEEELDGIIGEIDCDGSGTIDFDEFCKIMT